MTKLLTIFCTATCILAVQPSKPVDSDVAALAAPLAEGEITLRIRELSDTSYAKRSFATRRLCAIGMPAYDQLKAAAEGPNAEAALRAKAILDLLDRLWFTGVDVHLSLSKSRITWDEPVDLIVKMTNTSQFPARIPFEHFTAEESEPIQEFRQVGTMLDVSEVIFVRGDDGREIELKLDDIAIDPAVTQAVQRRLDDGPVRVLKPGESVTIMAPSMNRGWARYRLLDTGTYTLQLDYVPRWDDETLAAARIGRNKSNAVELTVTEAAPESVSRIGVEATVQLQQRGDALVASLTNRSDQTVTINKNFGSAPPFAEGRWVYEMGDVRRDVALRTESGTSWDDFDADLLVQTDPGATVELAMVNRDKLRKSLERMGVATEGAGWTIHFTYLNLFNRQWQRSQRATAVDGGDTALPFRLPLPLRILATSHNSNQITAPGNTLDVPKPPTRGSTPQR